ncbi:M15 family metallopeptidase, partial [Nocardiopsis coralliicola]
VGCIRCLPKTAWPPTSRRGAAGQALAAYTGADTGPLTAWLSPRGPQEALDRSSYLALLAEHRGADLDRAQAEAVAAEAAAGTAADAVDRRRAAADDADQARTDAQQALDGRRGALAGLLERQTELEAELAALEPADPAPPLARQASSGDGCDPGSVSGHPNGKIPEEELCPLDQPGEMLRADAAAAFRELDSAFSAEFGRGLCVTDSYRPLDEQERLFRDMEAGMAADPGTSTHGLGTAVDLCGGVESTGSGEHEWMLANAPDHGWHNPEWARGGFEPWHWEYQP